MTSRAQSTRPFEWPTARQTTTRMLTPRYTAGLGQRSVFQTRPKNGRRRVTANERFERNKEKTEKTTNQRALRADTRISSRRAVPTMMTSCNFTINLRLVRPQRSIFVSVFIRITFSSSFLCSFTLVPRARNQGIAPFRQLKEFSPRINRIPAFWKRKQNPASRVSPLGRDSARRTLESTPEC